MRLMPSAMPLVSSSEVVARLTHDVPPGAVLAFDADGTLWRGDIGIDVFTALLEVRGVKSAAGAALRDEAKRYDVNAPSNPTETARALGRAFEDETYAEERAFAMMAWVFAGYSEKDARAFALDVIEKRSLAERIHPEVLPILAWAKSRSVPVYVVSASATMIVRAAVERLGLDVADVFGMPTAVENGIVAPRLAGPATYGAGKIAALRAGIGDAVVLGAFGDSVSDLPMLGEARLPVAVRPKPALRERAGECPGLVELAPPPA
jgi:phosphatidylglycerophosphatase C